MTPFQSYTEIVCRNCQSKTLIFQNQCASYKVKNYRHLKLKYGRKKKNIGEGKILFIANNSNITQTANHPILVMKDIAKHEQNPIAALTQITQT